MGTPSSLWLGQPSFLILHLYFGPVLFVISVIHAGGIVLDPKLLNSTMAGTITTPPFTTSTNLGPLTSPVSFPPNCLSSLYDFNTLGLGLPWTYQTQGCALSTCCPSGNYYTQGYAWLTSFYSPGVCPASYRTCALPTVYSTFSSVSGESIALCCPHNYQCPDSDSNGACGSLLATSTSVVVLDNIYDQSIVSTRAWTLAPSMQTQGESSWQIAYPIQIRWGGSDSEPKTAAATTTGGGTAQLTQTSGPIATSTGTSTSASPTTSSKLSTGSIVGIITGSISAVAAVGGLAFKIYKWKAKKQQVVVADPIDKIGSSPAIQTMQRLCWNCGAAATTVFCTQCGSRV